MFTNPFQRTSDETLRFCHPQKNPSHLSYFGDSCCLIYFRFLICDQTFFWIFDALMYLQIFRDNHPWLWCNSTTLNHNHMTSLALYQLELPELEAFQLDVCRLSYECCSGSQRSSFSIGTSELYLELHGPSLSSY